MIIIMVYIKLFLILCFLYIQQQISRRREACARVFAALDTKGRGNIPRDDLIRALRLLNYNPTEEQMKIWLNPYRNIDFNFEDFLSFISNAVDVQIPEVCRHELRNAFAVFDKSNTGFIDKDTFVSILTKCGSMRLNDPDVKVWIDRLDVRKDGKIRTAELEELFIIEDDLSTVLADQKWESV